MNAPDFPPAANSFPLFQQLMRREQFSIAEFGCYNGGTTKQLASFGHPVWAFDTWEGIPKEDYDPTLDYSDPPGKWAPWATPEALFSDHPNIRIMKGRFVDTLPLVPKHVRFMLVHIDCDLYASYKQVLEWLPDRLLPGAAIVCDDYDQCAGATKAVDEWKLGGPLHWNRERKEIIWKPNE